MATTVGLLRSLVRSASCGISGKLINAALRAGTPSRHNSGVAAKERCREGRRYPRYRTLAPLGRLGD
jgi:hypothetical protein